MTIERQGYSLAGDNPWSLKAVETTTSGLKDTLKTQVRMAGGTDVYVWRLCTCGK